MQLNWDESLSPDYLNDDGKTLTVPHLNGDAFKIMECKGRMSHHIYVVWTTIGISCHHPVDLKKLFQDVLKHHLTYTVVEE